MQLVDDEAGTFAGPVVESSIEVVLDLAKDGRIRDELVEHIATFLSAKCRGEWTIALDGRTEQWSWMLDDD